MQETGNNIIQQKRITLRITKTNLSFAAVDNTAPEGLRYEPYIVRSGISMPANLREAFIGDNMLSSDYKRAQVLIDSKVLMVPVEEFNEENKEELYRHAFTDVKNDYVLHSVLPGENAVAIFSINKDLKLVLDDHFENVRIMPLMQSLWAYMHKRSFAGNFNKLYGYFHNKRLEVFSFNKNRFQFVNAYDTNTARDIAYFLLFVWKELNYDAEKDELHIFGALPEKEVLTENLKKYVRKVYPINPVAEFNRAPITQIKDLPFDLLTLFVKR